MAAKQRRDEFPADLKDILARRVGMRCSNPNCRQPTSGPQSDPGKAVNVGVAAHISAAAKGGPRFDPTMSAAERRSIENAIWLCQTHAKLIDNDSTRYTIDLLRQWKRLSEEAARLEIDSPAEAPVPTIPDVEIIRFYAQCFDRPAFHDRFHEEGSIEAFDKAIEDTITAINTGCLRARDGGVLSSARGKAFLRNAKWRAQMDLVVDLLRAIRTRYDGAIRLGQLHTHRLGGGRESYCIHDRELAQWMDSTRAQVLEAFTIVAAEAGVHAPHFPRRRHPHW